MNYDLGKPVIGPGSQPQDSDGELDFMKLPSGMMIYNQPNLPEPEEVEGIDDAIAVLKQMHETLSSFTSNSSAVAFDISHFDDNNRSFIDQLLGEGEVSVQWLDETGFQAQESVLAGIWRVIQRNGNELLTDYIEIAPIPSHVLSNTFDHAQTQLDVDSLNIPEDVYNAPPLLVEISEHLAAGDFSEPHVINLSLLPHTESDLAYLANCVGIGKTIILSRGYGNCRISSTKTQNVWWVQYYNSQDTLILNTIEISQIPDVACAAQEDFEDTAERLGEILELYSPEEAQ